MSVLSYSLRSVGAVFAGLALNAGLSLGLDAALRGAGVLPPLGQPMSDALHLLPFGYRLLVSVACFYVTARLAPSRPLQHALALAGIALALTLATTVAAWSAASAVEPKWFQVATLLSILPATWLGARLARASRVGGVRVEA